MGWRTNSIRLLLTRNGRGYGSTQMIRPKPLLRHCFHGHESGKPSTNFHDRFGLVGTDEAVVRHGVATAELAVLPEKARAMFFIPFRVGIKVGREGL